MKRILGLLVGLALLLPSLAVAQALNATTTYLNNYSRHDGGVGATTPTGNMTVCMWVKRTGGAYSTRTTFFQFEWSRDFTFGTTSTGTLSVIIDASAVVSGGAVTASVWKYACVTRASTTWEIWLGDESTTVSSQGSATNAGAPEGSSLRFFADDWNGFILDGSIAYPRIWNAALSGADMEAERLSAAVVRSSGLWAYWDFTSADPTIVDSSGHGRTIAKVNTVTAVAGPSLSGGSVIPIRHRVIGQ